MLLSTLPGGDTLHRRDQALIVSFAGRRDVLSTSAFNGGFHNSLKYVFNHDCKIEGSKDTPLKAPTYAGHMRAVAAELGLDPDAACGLSTAADMENVSIQSETYDDLTVTAVVTGGIDCNGGRVGDPADWHEKDGESVPAYTIGGTINIMLFIGAQLPPGTLARALVTCTEAKTAALQELLAPSLYSAGIATGSGTDGTILVSNPESPLVLTYAGKHSKLGELIGHVVMRAVKEALEKQTGLNARQQFDVFSRTGRYGITRSSLLTSAPDIDAKRLELLSKKNELVVLTSLYIHLLDQHQWGLIPGTDAVKGAAVMLSAMLPGYTLPSPAVGDTTNFLCRAFKDAFIGLCRLL
jgi:adenosylcobinamide amidohydrolase